MYIPLEPTLPLTLLMQAPGASSIEQSLPAGHRRFYAYGRNALRAALHHCGLRLGERVLVPTYICREAVEPILAAGGRPVYYRLSAGLSPDLDHLAQMMSGGARALVVVHYFGFVQDVTAARQMCDAAGVTLIEDCAHALLSRDADGRPAGSTGEFAVFSLRKFLPVPDGAALVARDPIPEPPDPPPGSVTTWLRLGRQVVCGLGQALGADPTPVVDALIRVKNGGDREGGTPAVNEAGVSSISRRIWSQLDPQRIRARRRENYQTLLGLLEEEAFQWAVFPELPEGACPMVLPLRVRGRARILEALGRRHVPAYPWPSLPHDLPDGQGDAVRWAEEMLLVPVHQDLTRKQIYRLGETMRAELVGGGVT